MKSKKLTSLLTLLLAVHASGSMAQSTEDNVPTSLPDGYHLVWNDEFSINGRPDPSNWSFEEGFVRNHEWQWYQSDNAIVHDGSLIITAREERRPNPTYKEGSKKWGEQRKQIECTSACVISKEKREFLYGRFLIRARIPAARGSWPAIWLLGQKKDYGWPHCGEIDIMEFYERGGIRSILANACWGAKEGDESVWDTEVVPFTHFTQKDSLWATQFHIWRMDWTPESIKLYLDDELLNEIDLSKTFNGVKGKNENPFHKPMYLLLNLAMGSRGGKVDLKAMPMRYEIDYVRVYQQK